MALTACGSDGGAVSGSPTSGAPASKSTSSVENTCDASAFDSELVGEVLELLAELRDGDMTMPVATHEMGFARQVADTVVFLDGGEIAEAGAPDEILEHPRDERTQRFLRRILDAGRL